MLWEKTYIGAPFTGKIYICLLFCIWRFAEIFFVGCISLVISPRRHFHLWQLTMTVLSLKRAFDSKLLYLTQQVWKGKGKKKGDNSSRKLFNYQGSIIFLIFHHFRFSVMLFLAFSNFPNILQLDCFIGSECLGLHHTGWADFLFLLQNRKKVASNEIRWEKGIANMV